MIFLLVALPLMKILLLVSFDEIKIDLTLKKSNILNFTYSLQACYLVYIGFAHFCSCSLFHSYMCRMIIFSRQNAHAVSLGSEKTV